jgi:SAM-dependent methyltransferase
MAVIHRLHATLVHPRRVEVLANRLAPLLPENASVLDVGAGDGRLAAAIERIRPDTKFTGIDVLPRDRSHIPVQRFDGEVIPLTDDSADVVLLVDVLHHTVDPIVLLREARRVARLAVIIKDHTRDGMFARTTLRIMDWIGNAGHGVALPYNYWTSDQWRAALIEVGLIEKTWITQLELYPKGVRWIFDRSLHFIAVLAVSEK